MNKINKTLLIIKPDAVKNKNIGKIIDIIEKNNIIIIQINMLILNKNTAKIFYYEHKNKNFYDELINFITSGPIIILILKGINIITKTRDLIGHTNFKEANKETIRKKFATSLIKNAVHASDSIKSFKKEFDIIFNNIKYEKKK